MRKNAKYLLVTLLTFLVALNVNAEECSYEEQVKMNNIVSTVKATYEAVDIDTGEKYFDDMHTDENGNYLELTYYAKGFNVKILNITEELFVEVTNSLGDSRTIYYSETDNGKIDLGVKEAYEIVTYSIKVRVAKGNCAGKELRTINLLVPRYNEYSESSFCIENSDFEYCQQYIANNSEIDFELFDREAKKYLEEKDKKAQEEKNNSFSERVKSFIKENKKILIISVTSLIIVGGTTIVIIVIRKRRRLI